MKIILILSLVLLGHVHAQSPYIREDSIGEVPKAPTPDPANPFTPLPFEAWVGQQFVLSPMTSHWADSGYVIRRSPTSDISYIPYKRYKGRTVTVTRVAKDGISGGTSYNVYFQVDGTKEKYITTDIAGSVKGFTLKRDIHYARENFIGKTLWLHTQEAHTYSAATKQTSSFKVKNLQPVTVTDVVLDDEESWPLRFVVKDAKGEQFFRVSKVSGTNSQLGFSDAYLFRDVFFTEDPRKKFSWDERTFSAIENGEVFAGMTQEQARISWGNPHDVNRTVTNGTVFEQWLYGVGRYLYFEGDKLTSIQQ